MDSMKRKHLKKHPIWVTTATWLWTIENVLQHFSLNSCYPETSVGEVVGPKALFENNLTIQQKAHT